MSAKYSRIISTGSALPAARITNEDLARRLAADGIETSDEWIRTRTGIEARRFVNGTTETTTTLAAAAAQKALEGGGVDPKTIDLIIVATTTPDQVFPSTAAAVQRLIGAAGCAAFDVQAVCAGFIYALNAADAMLRAGPYQRALVIGAETMSRVIDMKDRATCVLFGDGAGAVVLEASAKPGILAARMYAGADIYLMPSKSEPCGLSQMNAMRYGTVPVVHATGGLKDTVPPCDEAAKEGLGFTFQSYNADDFYAAIKRCLNLYNGNRQAFQALQVRDMSQDFSWDVPARKYMEAFQRMLAW